jgi:hypothetical protein
VATSRNSPQVDILHKETSCSGMGETALLFMQTSHGDGHPSEGDSLRRVGLCRHLREGDG